MLVQVQPGAKNFMDVEKAIKKRRSIRDFQEKPLTKEIEEKLIQALIWAPSAGNLESRKFYLIKEEKIKKEIAKATFGQNFVLKAPLIVVGCIDKNIARHYGKRGVELYAICDVACAIENLMLQAVELNLGTCFIGAFDEGLVSQILNLPSNLRPIAIVPVGFPNEKPSPPPRDIKKEIAIF